MVSGTAEHHADLHADLVDEDDHRVRALDVAGQLAQRLRHQARLQADVRIAHVAFDLRLRRQRRDRIDDDHVDRLFAGIRLRHQQIVDIDAELVGIGRVERVFGVDERGRAAGFLAFGDDLQRQRGLTRGFRAVDLDDPAARQPPTPSATSERQRAGRDHAHGHIDAGIAKPHDRSFAKLLFDLPQRRGQRFLFVVVHFTYLILWFAELSHTEREHKENF